MSQYDKAIETRRKHKEAQKAKEKEHKRICESVKNALLEVVESEDATVAQKLEASVILSKYI